MGYLRCPPELFVALLRSLEVDPTVVARLLDGLGRPPVAGECVHAM